MGNLFSCGVSGFSHARNKMESLSLPSNRKNVVCCNRIFGCKTFFEILLTLWIDVVRNDSDLTNLHMWVDM